MGLGGRSSRVAIGLALALVAGLSPLGTPGGSDGAHAGAPPAAAFTIPDPGGPVSPFSAPVDVPALAPDVLDVDPIILAANAATDALPAAQWEVEALAAQLGDDPEAAFLLVRDSIGFDPYAGVLRGAEGTLAARAGNAWDRALLLKALLDEQGRTSRFATADLSSDAATSVVERAFAPPSAPLPSAAGSGLHPTFAAAVQGRAARDLALLEAALGTPPRAPDDRERALADVVSHAWVQVEEDAVWVDLDPTLPDATPGTPITAAAATLDALPVDRRVQVDVRLVAEQLVNGVVSMVPVLDERLDAAAVADQQVLLYFGPTSGGSGGLLGGVGSPDLVVPVLSVGGEVRLGTGFIISASEGGGLLGGTTDTDLVSLWLEIESPAGRQPARHMILDRAPGMDRGDGSITRDGLTPPNGGVEFPLELRGVRHVLVSTGGFSPLAANLLRGWAAWSAATDAADPAAVLASSVESAYWPIAIGDRELVVGSELDVIPGVDDDEVRAFVAQPRVYVVTVGVDPAAPDRVLGSTDLLVDPIRILAAPDAPPDAAARHRAWYGVLQSALETEHARAAAANLDAASVELVSASIGAADAPLTVLAPGSEVPSGAPGRLRAAVTAGFTVVVTGDPAAARAWWELAEDGTVRAILAPSLGGVRRVGGPRPPAIPRVTPPQQTPNQLPQRPQPQPQKPPARTPTRPPVGKPVCTGNEQTILQRCVAFFARFAVSELVVAGIMAAVSIASLYVLGRLIAGG